MKEQNITACTIKKNDYFVTCIKSLGILSWVVGIFLAAHFQSCLGYSNVLLVYYLCSTLFESAQSVS